MAVFAPIPRASVRTTTSAKPGLLLKARTAKRKFCFSDPIVRPPNTNTLHGQVADHPPLSYCAEQERLNSIVLASGPKSVPVIGTSITDSDRRQARKCFLQPLVPWPHTSRPNRAPEFTHTC